MIKTNQPIHQTYYKKAYSVDPVFVDVIQQFAKVLNGKKVGETRSPTIQTGPRNGKYLTQKGGSPFTYKTVSFNHAFVNFIQQNILQQVYRYRKDLMGVRVIYDECNELHRNANKYIVIMYEFEQDAMQLYYVDAQKAMMALYALQNQPIATVEEKTCLQEFMTNIPRFVMAGGKSTKA